MKNGPKITFSRLAAVYLVAVVVAASVLYTANCFSPHINPKPVFGWFLALVGVFFGVAARSWGLTALTVALPVATGLTAQLGSFGYTQFVTLNNPGLDLAQGFLLGAMARYWRELKPASVPGRYTLVVAAIMHIYLLSSTIATIANNLIQTTSPFLKKALLLNGMQLRQLAVTDDYFPMAVLYVQTLTLGLIFVGWRLWRNSEDAGRRLLAGLTTGGLVLGVYAVIQRSLIIGHFRDSVERGLNSLMPDLHAYASFALLAATAALVLMGTALTERRWRTLLFGGGAFFVTCVGLYLSGSRFTLVAAPLVLGYAAYVTLVRPHGKRVRLIVTTTGLALITAAALAIAVGGYGRTDFAKLEALVTSSQFTRFNAALSNRPEIWATAFHMTAQRPLSGVGNGAFYRLSSIPGYSQSDFLMKRGGENAHNFLLQLLAELGIPGLLLVTALVVLPGSSPATRLLIVAMMAGNVFAHSLLVHEMMMIFALILAVHHACRDSATETLTMRLLNQLRQPVLRWGLVSVATLGTFFWWLQALSHEALPFRYGDLCSQHHERYPDGWITGRFNPRPTRRTRKLDISLRAGHPDVEDSPVAVRLRVEDPDSREVLLNEAVKVNDRNLHLFTVKSGKLRRLRLLVETDRCFVPKSLGQSNDGRRLALNLRLNRP